MHQSSRAAAFAALVAAGNAASLADICTVSNVQAALPSNGTLLGIELIPSSVTATAVSNATSTGSSVAYSYCNVSVTYTHTGRGDSVSLIYAFPEPSSFTNRFYVAGGGGYSLSTSATGGLAYGAASGATDAGYDAFEQSYDEAVLYGNGTINWDATHMFGYQALGEMTIVGKAISRTLYGLGTDGKIYTYFEGCSDGGREGWSQVQRWGEEYDGVVVGAPAFRYGQQQVNHLFSNVVEKTMDYYPPPCELDKIVNMTIAACDPLDGRTDGVVSRSDLCKLSFDFNTTIGASYSCAAQNSSSLGFGFGQKRKRQMGGSSSTSYEPAQNGTVSAEGAAVAKAIYDGLVDSQGQRGYLSFQTACSFQDATTAYNQDTGAWELSIASTGGEFVTKFIELVDLDNLSSLDNVTYDTLVDWMNAAMIRYTDTLQTTLPDITTFQSHGGKILHYHGESDDSVPTGSSIHYFDSVRTTMYPSKSYNDSVDALGDWYRLFLVPGAAHCSTNTLQPGPYPEDNMATIIDWVENGVTPSRLNATVTSGANSGEVQQLCSWPLRPYWAQGNSSTFECVYDQTSIDSWTYVFDAFKLPVY